MNQKQHIIPQVYLRQFGYRDRGGIWKVPTLNIKEIKLMNKIDKTLIRQSKIKSLLREENIYDIPIAGDKKRQLEDFFKLTEDHYPQVIKEIQTKNKITADKKEMLLGFISLLYVRTRDYRLTLDSVIDRKDLTYLLGVLEGNKNRVDKVLNLPKKSAINFMIAFSGGYIYKRLQNFRVSIIKTIPGEKWATTDNPVFLVGKSDKQKRIDFIGMDTKIMFPLSPDFLAYIDHKDSNVELYQGIENFIENRINQVTKETFEKMWHDLTDRIRITEFLIFPT